MIPNESSVTICGNCAHHLNGHFYKGEFLKGRDVWYDHYCKANPRNPTIDPVTGESGYAGINDMGGTYITKNPYHYCRSINKGLCPFYEG